jgi:hypothetical protein
MFRTASVRRSALRRRTLGASRRGIFPLTWACQEFSSIHGPTVEKLPQRRTAGENSTS